MQYNKLGHTEITEEGPGFYSLFSRHTGIITSHYIFEKPMNLDVLVCCGETNVPMALTSICL